MDLTNGLDLKSGKIMVVEDNAATLTLLKEVLQIEGYSRVVCTQDPTQVIDLYKEHHSDLMLLDLMMPKMDGFEVMDRLKVLGDGKLPSILVLTALDDHEHRIRALGEGALDFVAKPFNRVELLTRIRNLLKISLSEKALRNQNAILEQTIQERTKELYDTRRQTIQLLGRAVEYRDNETGLHIIRISKISALLGKAMGLNEQECDLLFNASPMHDIGKIGVPDHILFKPGKLNEEEWETMKLHSTMGADMLSGYDSNLLETAHTIALTHHEKWDGSGYPSGLKGTEIPLVGRIVAIADVFDALTSERKYKSAWTIEKTVALLKKERGKHFDPELVDRFIDLLPEIIEIKSAHDEPKKSG
ncbi:response regulator [Nitrospira defluvii]|nr:response regulator [Nitrospira defluvii]